MQQPRQRPFVAITFEEPIHWWVLYILDHDEGLDDNNCHDFVEFGRCRSIAFGPTWPTTLTTIQNWKYGLQKGSANSTTALVALVVKDVSKWMPLEFCKCTTIKKQSPLVGPTTTHFHGWCVSIMHMNSCWIATQFHSIRFVSLTDLFNLVDFCSVSMPAFIYLHTILFCYHKSYNNDVPRSILLLRHDDWFQHSAATSSRDAAYQNIRFKPKRILRLGNKWTSTATHSSSRQTWTCLEPARPELVWNRRRPAAILLIFRRLCLPASLKKNNHPLSQP